MERGGLGEVTPPGPETSSHVALALAAQHGHAEVVRLHLDAARIRIGTTPTGNHSHSPL